VIHAAVPQSLSVQFSLQFDSLRFLAGPFFLDFTNALAHVSPSRTLVCYQSPNIPPCYA
jgi:hypothetical protein